MQKSNNEISRDILSYLKKSEPKAVKFIDLVSALDIAEKVLFKNLFFLEENHLVQLMSSYPTGATYPTIHMVKIREEGTNLLDNEEKLNDMFPTGGISSRLDLYKINSLTFDDFINVISRMLEKEPDNKEEQFKKLKKTAANLGIDSIKLGKIFGHH